MTITCPICSIENSHLAVICQSCGSYVQSKVDTLDLFATVWQLIESPTTAFHRIAIASHKNYIVFLAALMGIAHAFILMWIAKVGDSDIPLANLLATGFLAGPLLGIVNLLVLGLIQKAVARAFRLATRYKNALAVVAYASVPIVLSVVFLLPIEILTFGKFFFSANPSPYLLKPVSYVLLLGLDGLCLLWSIVLYVLGTKVLYDIRMRNAVAISGLTLSLFVFLIFIGISTFLLQRQESGAERLFTEAAYFKLEQ